MQPRESTSGFTLLETMVTLVIITLITTLTLQVIGFFSLAQGKLIAAGQNTIEQQRAAFWFRESISGGVAPMRGDELEGDRSGFTLTTISPLNHLAGYPMRIRWQIREGRSADSLYYQEEQEQDWPILEDLLPGSGFFEFIDQSGEFHNAWPPEEQTAPPKMLKLIRFHAEGTDPIDWYVAHQTNNLRWQFEYD